MQRGVLNHLPVAETLEYAKWLGMDEEGDEHLFWIAKEGLKVSPTCCTPTNTPFNRRRCRNTGSLVRHR